MFPRSSFRPAIHRPIYWSHLLVTAFLLILLIVTAGWQLLDRLIIYRVTTDKRITIIEQREMSDREELTKLRTTVDELQRLKYGGGR